MPYVVSVGRRTLPVLKCNKLEVLRFQTNTGRDVNVCALNGGR